MQLQLSVPFAETEQYESFNWIQSIGKLCKIDNIDEFCVTSHQDLKNQSHDIHKKAQKKHFNSDFL